MSANLHRREFLSHAALGIGALSGLSAACLGQENGSLNRQPYRGPNVILVRFGGGVRRLETITEPEKTACPFIYHELYQKQGILFNNVEIESNPGIETSHGQGTLYILTGKYDEYKDITGKPFADRFEAAVPTIFEYFRKVYDVPEHQALIINGEDRIDEEFYTFSNHHLYGVHYRSTVLSLYRFKTYLLRQLVKDPNLVGEERVAKEQLLAEMEHKDYRVGDSKVKSPELDAFWEKWHHHYRKTGLVNPRGDRVLTELAIRSIKQLRPKLMMINYQDPDYVHWGNSTFYAQAISIIDDGVRQLYDACQADEEYRDNTVFVVVPDCGRDNNRCMAIPFQHHFGSRTSHEVFVMAAGPGIAHSKVPVDKLRQQTSVAGTIGQIMNFPTPHVEAGALEEVFA